MAYAQPHDIAAPAVQVAPGQAGAINLKIENAKLPIFYGEPNKDTITAQYLIQRIESLTATNHWSPDDAYHHFSLALQGSAQEWIRMVQGEFDNAEKTWTYIEPLFRKEFSTIEDDTALLDQLSNLQKRPNERIRDYASRIHRIKELMQRSNTEVAPITAPADAGGMYTQAEVLAYGNKVTDSLFKYFSLQLFKVGLPAEVRKVMHQQKPTSLNKAIDIAREQEVTKDKPKSIMAVEEDQELNVEAIQPQFRPQRNQAQTYAPRQTNFWRQQNQQQNLTPRSQPVQQQQQRQFNPQQQQQRPRPSNTNSKQICLFCRIPGHHQEDCRKRIAANAPCYSASGKPYFPKQLNDISIPDQEVMSLAQPQDFLC